MLDAEPEWMPPLVETEALRGAGVPELWEAVGDHRRHLERDGGLERRRRASVEHEVVAVAVAQARRRLEEALREDDEVREVLAAVHERRLDPLTATRDISERVLGRRARDAQ
jgi:LAO/AO transport system kinase